MQDFLFTAGSFIVALAILIAVHEFGHFWVARKLGVSENTVKFHVRNILDKFHLHNRAQVVSYALRAGIVVPESEP